MWQRDGRTDRRTDGQNYDPEYRARIAVWCGSKCICNGKSKIFDTRNSFLANRCNVVCWLLLLLPVLYNASCEIGFALHIQHVQHCNPCPSRPASRPPAPRLTLAHTGTPLTDIDSDGQRDGLSSFKYTVSQKKNCAKLFLSQLRQISTNFDNFWQKDGNRAEIMQGALTLHLT